MPALLARLGKKARRLTQAGGAEHLTASLLLAFSTASPAQDVDYQHDIQPLFDRYCVACHACFDAPCQLNLTHAEGLMRGASKRKVYNARRLEAEPPTRLFVDAQTPEAWRQKGFFPLTEHSPQRPALLLQLLKPGASDAPASTLSPVLAPHLGRQNQCPTPQQAQAFTQRQPQVRMPLGFPAMPEDARNMIQRWLELGANATLPPPTPTADEAGQISQWEAWLNGDSAEQALLSRWLFEHWALAKLYFGNGESGHFFRLVRSRTAPGEPSQEIATRRPNDDPGEPFHYRFQMERGTRVYKTQVTFRLSPELFGDLRTRFFSQPWQAGPLPGYGGAERSNPFATFAAIPADARYRFMLDHAEYFVRTFIRGPVCRGQIATAVIRDHFWVMFQAPEHDPYIVDPDFRRQANQLLNLPGIEDDLLAGPGAWFDSSTQRNAYIALRQKALARLAPRGPGMETIWDGNGDNGSALLTVFRHHDSATVRQGWIGHTPLTLWWLDFPLLEQSYYNLVVNFDVFGNIAHQAQTRLYFDLIRNGAEQNFLRLLPARSRQRTLDRWYEGSGLLKLWIAYQSIDTHTPSALDLPRRKPKEALVERLLARFAPLNPPDLNRGELPDSDSARVLSRLSGIPAERMPSVSQLPNASLLMVVPANSDANNADADAGALPELYTLVRNRRHSNVAFMLGESLRYVPDEDSLTVVPGIATSYPNFIFRVPEKELPAFTRALRSASNRDLEATMEKVLRRWGVAANDPAFWDHFHQVTRYLEASDPVNAGILDIYRYQNP
ncbi:fatty acid cis/trans isomerase [Motiliproteus sp. SC1-56]|uniref:fatty acid cis/trans isomerase n=1 Tax=Motiliproteus sp. SC1-56 TaxID=2799565 RepID=UPI001A9099FD|nr:fatty acid cis/trans isomerase [Motiliproteus sp. SC1-56]